MSAHNSSRSSLRLYRALLRVLPRELRREYGADMTRLFEERLRDANTVRARLGVCWRAILDVISVAGAERVSKPMAAPTRAEPYRRSRRRRFAFDLLSEIRLSVRSLRRSPAFTATSVLTLGVALGTVTALFSVVYGVLLRPLPYPDYERLYLVNSPFLTPTNLDAWVQQQRVADATGAFTIGRGTASTAQGALSVRFMPVGRGFLDLLGLKPTAGRLFNGADHSAGAPLVAVVSERFWLQQFGGGAAVGRSLTIDDKTYEIIGTLPIDETLRYDELDLWLPMEQTAIRGLSLVVRLAQGVSADQAHAQLLSIAQQQATPEQRAKFEGLHVGDLNMHPVLESMVGDVSGTLWILLGASVIVLLLGAANIATLSIGRAVSRREELAVRVALGAGRGRLLRQLMVEAGVLAVGGIVLGLFVASLAPRILALAPDLLPRSADIRIDLRVAAFASACGLLALLVFSVLPGLAVTRWNHTASLRAATTRAPRVGAAQGSLAVIEIAAAFVLAIGALLLLRTYSAIRPDQPGFQVNNRVGVTFNLPRAGYTTEESALPFVESLLEKTAQLPGAPRAAVTTDLPLTGGTMMLPIRREGAAPDKPETMHVRAVSPGYLELMEMPVLYGRALSRSYTRNSVEAVINETAARKVWGDAQRALGQRFTIKSPDHDVDLEVSGIVRDAWSFSPDPRPEVFTSFWTMPYRRFSLLLADDAARPLTLQNIREMVNGIDSSVPVLEFESLKKQISWITVQPRFQATLLSLITLVAMLLAGTGCFAVLAQLIGRRLHDLAIRRALGATGGDVVRWVLARTVWLVVPGIVLGSALALAGTRVLASSLYGVSPTDKPTFATAALLLTALVLCAALLPTARAVRASPLAALKTPLR